MAGRIAFTLLVLLAVPTGRAEIEFERQDWTGSPAPGTLIRVENLYGDIRLRRAPYGELEVRAVIQRGDAFKGEARLVHASAPGREQFRIEFTGAEPAAFSDARVDMVLGFPEALAFEASMNDGRFTMHDGDFAVSIVAERADLRVVTTGPVDVRSWHGDIELRLNPEGTPAGGRIQTSSGAVNLIIPDPDPLSLRIISGVAVTTDSLQLLSRRSREGREWRFTGSDQAVADYFIQTDSGPIRLVAESHL